MIDMTPTTLAALSRAIDPAIAERAGEVLERLRGRPDAIEDVDRLRDEAADLITTLLAQNAALRAERDALAAEVKQADTMLVAEANASLERLARAEAAEAKVKKLRAERDDALTFLDNAVAKAPEPLKALGKYLAGRLDEDEWPTAEQHLNAAAKACADRTTAAEAQVEKLRGALQIARVHVANNAEGWSVSRGAARDDLTIVDAALTTEAGHE